MINMKPKRFKLTPSTTVDKISLHEDDVLLTVNNMDSTVDLYVTDEGSDTEVWERVPAGSLMEIVGDFEHLWYKSASTWGATDKAHVILERSGE